MIERSEDPRKRITEQEELVLVTRGRRTGREHRVRLWFAREGDLLWLRTDESRSPRRTDPMRTRMVRPAPDWYRNLLADPRCRVVIGEERDARFEPGDATDDDRRHLVALWRAKYGPEWVQDWYVETGRVPVKVRLTASGSASGSAGASASGGSGSGGA